MQYVTIASQKTVSSQKLNLGDKKGVNVSYPTEDETASSSSSSRKTAFSKRSIHNGNNAKATGTASTRTIVIPVTLTRRKEYRVITMTQPQRNTKNRATALNQQLTLGYPNARCELNYTNPLQLLVATILSAQSTDNRVNNVTPELFAEYPTAHALAAATPKHLQDIIRPTGLHTTKTTQLIQLGQQLVKNHGGAVPDTRDELTKLPGVGRKTANVVLANAFNQPALSVDTHFARIVKRFGLTDETAPDKIEADIASLLGKSEWTMFSHRVIFHGRRICHSRNPACGACFLAPMCPSYGIGETDPARAQNRIKAEPAERQHLLQLASQ